MAYFQDLSDYIYFSRHGSRGAVNVGWLERGRPFDQQSPSEELRSTLWRYCEVSVMQARGLHQCDLCPPPARLIVASRDGHGLRLGSAEIRVFSPDGKIYAAPNLIYHYVRTHHYKPPQEFLTALNEGPRPPSPEFFEHLRQTGLDWNETHRCPGDTCESKPMVTGYRVEKVDGELRRVDVQFPVHLDED